MKTDRQTTAQPHSVVLLVTALVTLSWLGGCASPNFNPTGVRHEAPDVGDCRDTTISQTFAASENLHPGQSGFNIIAYDLEALVARVALADAAEKSLDVQSYIYATDTAGSLLTEHLLQAADRGVQVRLLLDDHNVRGDGQLLALCANPRIQVKIFNPKRWRHPWLRLPQYLFDFRRLDHRMHNKLFVADKSITILGGRNIGNDYFNVETTNAFRDFDLLAVGPAARQSSGTFEQYWNSPWSVPVPTLAQREPRPADLTRLRAQLKARREKAPSFSEHYATLRDRYLPDIKNDPRSLTWADGEVVADAPDAVVGETMPDSTVQRRFDQECQLTLKEILIESSYFVPSRRRMQTFQQLHDRGVAATLLTCGLASTDAPIIYGAYRSYRRDLLDAGVDLYEFKYRAAHDSKGPRWYRLRPSYAFLHSKVIVFDHEKIWIGSFNLDARSEKLNTELVAVVRSRELAAELAQLIHEDLTPERSWHVQLAPALGTAATGSTPPSSGAIIWTGEKKGKTVVLTHEPVRWWTKLFLKLALLIPRIEREL